MKMYTLLIFAALVTFSINSLAQKDRANDYRNYYPIGEDANIRYLSTAVKNDKILFEANPIIRYSFVNNFQQRLMNGEDKAYAYYVAFKPQLRMFREDSEPVKMASQKVFLGSQYMWPQKRTKKDISYEAKGIKRRRFFAVSLESGHYSNGQYHSALSDTVAHRSKENDELYAIINDDTDLSKMINRNTGNFSTNITELIFQYRWLRVDSDDKAYQWFSAQLGYVRYHDKFWGFLNFGGYDDNDIKLYGRNRFVAGGEYVYVYDQLRGKRFSIASNMELIQGAHPSVNPFRGEVIVSVFPFSWKKDNGVREVGFFISGIYGHDNYNLRFVDSVTQFSAGVKWSIWPPLVVVNPDR